MSTVLVIGTKKARKNTQDREHRAEGDRNVTCLGRQSGHQQQPQEGDKALSGHLR
jgi:hypothetical protein